jgi:hypothetical protein
MPRQIEPSRHKAAPTKSRDPLRSLRIRRETQPGFLAKERRNRRSSRSPRMNTDRHGFDFNHEETPVIVTIRVYPRYPR